MQSLKSITYLLSFLLFLTSCDQLLLGDQPMNTPVDNFELLWNDYREHYANFRVKRIDWEDTYARYRPLLNANSTEEDLYEVLVPMLAELNDAHVQLSPTQPDFPDFNSGFPAVLFELGAYDFDDELVRNNYLETLLETFDEDIFHGLLPGNLGYMYWGEMPEMDLPFVKQIMDRMMADLANTDGIIIDIRDNNGGEDEAGRLITSYFANDGQLYMQSRYKVGPGADDFEPMREWFIEDRGNTAYANPIVLMTDRYCISAGETFALALQALPQVTTVGDTTSGAFSDTVNRELPNRWGYRIPVAEVFDASGRSWEGIGLPPDIVLRNTPEEIANGQDKMLEMAMEQF
ncbi:MAG: S41 family peptidase [Bacteroidota bacterium]